MSQNDYVYFHQQKKSQNDDSVYLCQGDRNNWLVKVKHLCNAGNSATALPTALTGCFM